MAKHIEILRTSPEPALRRPVLRLDIVSFGGSRNERPLQSNASCPDASCPQSACNVGHTNEKAHTCSATCPAGCKR